MFISKAEATWETAAGRSIRKGTKVIKRKIKRKERIGKGIEGYEEKWKKMKER